MITEKQILESPAGTILLSGVANTSIPNEAIKWVAVRGGGADWAVYMGDIEDDLDLIRTDGDKLYDKRKIQAWTGATDEAMRRYRE